MINSEVNTGKRNAGRPKMHYKACIKADLKCFGMWEKYKQSNLNTMASVRHIWRRDINLDACEFQKNWINHRIANRIKRN